MPKTVQVTLEADGAWEVWTCEVPDDADGAWVRENFHTLDDKSLADSGADVYSIAAVEGEGMADGDPEIALGAGSLLDAHGEVVVALASGWTLRSGVYHPEAPDALTSGEYVRLCRPDGREHLYWDQREWTDDPALVMGAIINSAAGLVLEREGATS